MKRIRVNTDKPPQESCCCAYSSFAYGTLIATPAGMKRIEDFAVGDNILVASSMTQNSDGSLQLEWSPDTVWFSAGTRIEKEQMIYIHYGEDKWIVVTRDHILLMPNGKLKRAERLLPGQDQLVLAEGGAVPIQRLAMSDYLGGIHHIATGVRLDNKIEGHLLNANGIVSADYQLQINSPNM